MGTREQEQEKGSVDRSSIVDEGKGARAGISGKEQHFGRKGEEKEKGTVGRSSIVDEGTEGALWISG